ncbi:hypothetical protein [Rhodococcus qingshengii]|uniref:hypothetical protein n=1 Tax=Rhodococcus qingshengii TaxID=334542 RepID=UPI0035E0FC6B
MFPETNYQRIRRSQQKPWDRFPETADRFGEVVRASDDLYEALKMSLNIESGTPKSGVMWKEDRLTATIAARALENIDAFMNAMETWNISVASTLVRLQVDNLMIINLLIISPNPEYVVDHIVSGEKLNSLPLPEELNNLIPEERRDRKMYHKEWVLQRLAADRFPWLPNSYEETSGYVHFSSDHEGHIFKISGNNIEGRVPANIEQYSQRDIEDLVNSMREPSQALVKMMNEWTSVRKQREEDT